MARLSKILFLFCVIVCLRGDGIMIQGPIVVIAPVGGGDTSSGGFVLLEDGSKTLLEDGTSSLLKESGGAIYNLLLEDGSTILLEDGDKVRLEN